MSKPTYDKYYKQRNYFGKPYEGLVSFFKDFEPKCKVLDLGCGQGRDTLFLGRLGYAVKGIDISNVGINQLNETVKMEKLNVETEIADIYTYPISSHYDIILLDSLLHFYKDDMKKEADFIIRIAKELKNEGVLCNVMIKGKKRETYLKNTLNSTNISWETLADEYVNYPEANSQFHMYVIRKKM